MKHHILSLAMLLVLASPALATELYLQTVIDTFLAENPQVPGIAVHIICPSRGWDNTLVAGRTDRPFPAPALEPQHTFRIASNTKTYVAAGVLRLVEMGELNLDDTLAQRLPIQYADLLRTDGYDLEAMTIAQVLSHTSGLYEHPADPRYAEMILADPQHHWTVQEQVGYCVEWGDPVGLPGVKYQYSDTGYILLGVMVEQATGRNLGQAIAELLDYEKLNLPATWWEIFEEKPAAAGPRAHQYYGAYDSTDWHPSLDLHGGGGILTDASDLAWFLRRLLNGEVFDDPESLVQMTNRGTSPYRLGLIRTEMSGHLAWGHTGFWNTFAFHLPSLDLTVAGAVLDHDAGRGQDLAGRLVVEVLDLD